MCVLLIIEHFKEKLNAWMKQLISDAETTITHIQEDSSKVADDNDRATLEEELIFKYLCTR
jgi:DnaK suppressor protein